MRVGSTLALVAIAFTACAAQSLDSIRLTLAGLQASIVHSLLARASLPAASYADEHRQVVAALAAVEQQQTPRSSAFSPAQYLTVTRDAAFALRWGDAGEDVAVGAPSNKSLIDFYYNDLLPQLTSKASVNIGSSRELGALASAQLLALLQARIHVGIEVAKAKAGAAPAQYCSLAGNAKGLRTALTVISQENAVLNSVTQQSAAWSTQPNMSAPLSGPASLNSTSLPSVDPLLTHKLYQR